jgi:DinB superfamily
MTRSGPISVCVTAAVIFTLCANLRAQAAAQQKQPTAAELSAKETVAAAFLRTLDDEEYELRSAAEFVPADKYSYRPTQGDYGGVYPGYGPKELRTFAEQIKHAACSNLAFSAELDGKTPPPSCDTGGPSPAKTRDELVAYLRDSFKALRKSISAITQKNMFEPIEGPYAGPNTRLGLANVAIWHCADHYGQLVLYMRLNGIVPPASRPNPPELKD